MYNQPPPPQYYGQPGYAQPPGYGYGQPPPPPPGQTIIIQNNTGPTISNMCQVGDISDCPVCNRQTDNIMRQKVGAVTMAWCCCLFVTTGVLCWIPFCVDSCKDTEVVCQGCGMIKSTVSANCC